MPERLVPQFIERLHNRDPGWEEFVHPEAEFSLLPFHGETVRGREAIARRLNSWKLKFYRPRVLDLWRLDDSTVLVKGTAVYPLAGHGQAAGQAFWLDQIRDGLVWRVRGFTS